MGDPVQTELRDYELTLWRAEAHEITIEQAHEKVIKTRGEQHQTMAEHP